MNGRLLIITAKYLAPLLVLFSLYVLFRGHDAPGGGFIGGLIASVAFSLLLIALGMERTKSLFPFDARSLIGIGLLIALASSLWSVISGEGFFKGEWFDLPLGVHLSLGTPIFFDLGVYLVVLGVLMTILFSLLED